MVEKRRGKGSKAAVSGLKKQVRKAAGRNKSGDDFWVREDGALCWGNECVVINPDKDGNIDVEINKNRGCNVHAFAEAVGRTVGKGGRTTYRINDD